MNLIYLFYEQQVIKFNNNPYKQYAVGTNTHANLIKILHGYQYVRTWKNGNELTITFDLHRDLSIEFRGLQLMLGISGEVINRVINEQN